MPSDWQRALVALSATVVGAAVLAVLYFGRSIFLPLALAVFLAFVLSPVVARLQRRGLGRTTAVLATVGLLGLGSLGAGAVIAHQVVSVGEEVTDPARKEAIKQKVLNAKRAVIGDGNSRAGAFVDDISEAISPRPAVAPQAVIVEQPSPSFASKMDVYLSPAAEVLGAGAFTFILTVFMLLKREDLRNRMIRLLGAGKVTTTTKAVDDASQRISRYLLSQLMLNSAFGLVITVGLFALGVKYSVLWGFIATLMR
ncbi:MAG: AI-2E family transporter, partial [Gemmataceae bacterium]|nr:AI-2E family transporter [Gemmataceae bacterium]